MMMMMMTFLKSNQSIANPAFFLSVAVALGILTSTCWAIAPVAKPIMVKETVENISLQSILKPEQQKPAEAYAVGGVDSYLAEQGRRSRQSNGNLWQVIFSLLAVSAGAWWLLNTAWFKALAQQKEAQLLQKNGGYLSSPTPIMVNRSSAVVSSPLQNTKAWVSSLLRPATAETTLTAEPALASILQTLPLPGGQFLVMVKIGETIHSLATGGPQPLLIGTWHAQQLLSLTSSDSQQTEKWMAQTPPTPTPTPTPTARKEEALPLAEILTDYEALNDTEEALFGQLLQAETKAF